MKPNLIQNTINGQIKRNKITKQISSAFCHRIITSINLSGILSRRTLLPSIKGDKDLGKLLTLFKRVTSTEASNSTIRNWIWSWLQRVRPSLRAQSLATTPKVVPINQIKTSHPVPWWFLIIPPSLAFPRLPMKDPSVFNLYQFKIGFFPTDPPSTAIATRNFWRDD